ncbi:MAG: winged helix-turn-helix transcriptional regulator, partial [Candidatus Heimdallarchaeota archaeon]|nr:winged helix-turn-helix transcriptional regulator [Candidatus Heimdallarchaeota archaeon]
MDSLFDLISVHSQLEKSGKSLPTKVRISLNRYADHNRGKIEGHGKLIILASNDWKAVYTSTLSEIKSSENLVQTILHGLSTLHSGNISDTGFTYQSISKLRTLTKKIDDFYLIYCYKGSSYIASEKIESLGNLIEINGILLNFQGDSKNSHFIGKEIETIISEFFDLPRSSSSVLTDIYDETKSIKNLTKFKDLLHPFRLSIIYMLEKNYQLPRSVIQEILGINPGSLNSHLNKLLKMEYIGKKLEFIDEKPRDVYFIQSAGTYQLISLKETLQGTLM